MSNYIALAIDFKEFTPSILETGLFLAKNLYPENKVVLFHVIEYFLTPPHYLLSYFKEEKLKLEDELSKLSERFKDGNISIESKIILGNFWEALENFIKNLKPHLLVLGYHFYKFKVSTSEKMLERLDCNFLVVKDKPLQKIEKILCCIDFSETSISSLRIAKFICEKLGAQLKVLNVIPEINIGDKNLLNKVLEEEKSKRQKAWQELINNLSLDEKMKNLDFEIKYGERVKKILETIRVYFPDLLLIGKTGKMVKLGLGSITKELLRRVDIPIWIVGKS